MSEGDIQKAFILLALRTNPRHRAANMTQYVLDSEVECDRLERQALLHGPERVLEHFQNIKPNARILDVGAGSGWACRQIAANFPKAEVIGLDITPGYINYAQQRADVAGLTNLKFIQGDAQNLPFDPASFDTVWSQFVLYFLPDPKAAIAGFAKVLKPGGTLLTAFHERPMLDNYPKDQHLQAQLESLFTAITDEWDSRKIPAMYRAAGLNNIDVKIEIDPVYSSLGNLSPAQHRNIEEGVGALARRAAHLLGGPQQAEEFLANWLAYLNRNDVTSISTYWVISGQVPTNS